MTHFGRVAVVNRGEPAMRLIHAVREWNAEGRPHLRTIALHTAVDRRAMFVREADEAVLIGPDDPDDLPATPYRDLTELERGLRAAVIHRKLSLGSRAHGAERTIERLLSVDHQSTR